ncbi:polysaccharide lyase-domain-containing protein [Mycena olivaceomarginata]|nr:polysaccharide lyase-domain-containing protein [Mycena olivaceomarginata]
MKLALKLKMFYLQRIQTPALNSNPPPTSPLTRRISSFMQLTPILIGVLATLSAMASATPTFINPGTLNCWNFVLEENQGTVDQVSNVDYGGSNGTSIKVTQTYDPGYTGRYHSEVHSFQGYHRGEQGFYGFAFRLQQGWQFAPAQSCSLAQFIADFTDTGCDDWMPSSMHGETAELKNLATVSAGVWHKVVIQANWQNDGTGFYKSWFDGVKVLEKLDIATTIDDTREFQFHVGLYANGWHDDGGMQGTRPF